MDLALTHIFFSDVSPYSQQYLEIDNQRWRCALDFVYTNLDHTFNTRSYEVSDIISRFHGLRTRATNKQTRQTKTTVTDPTLYDYFVYWSWLQTFANNNRLFQVVGISARDFFNSTDYDTTVRTVAPLNQYPPIIHKLYNNGPDNAHVVYFEKFDVANSQRECLIKYVIQTEHMHGTIAALSADDKQTLGDELIDLWTNKQIATNIEPTITLQVRRSLLSRNQQLTQSMAPTKGHRALTHSYCRQTCTCTGVACTNCLTLALEGCEYEDILPIIQELVSRNAPIPTGTDFQVLVEYLPPQDIIPLIQTLRRNQMLQDPRIQDILQTNTLPEDQKQVQTLLNTLNDQKQVQTLVNTPNEQQSTHKPIATNPAIINRSTVQRLITKWFDTLITPRILRQLSLLPPTFKFVLKTGDNMFDDLWLTEVAKYQALQPPQTPEEFQTNTTRIVQQYLVDRDISITTIGACIARNITHYLTINQPVNHQWEMTIRKWLFGYTDLIDPRQVPTIPNIWVLFLNSQQASATGDRNDVNKNKRAIEQLQVAVERLFSDMLHITPDEFKSESMEFVTCKIAVEILTGRVLTTVDDLLTSETTDAEIEQVNELPLIEMWQHYAEPWCRPTWVRWLLAIPDFTKPSAATNIFDMDVV